MRTRLIRKSSRGESGANLVEAAIALPIFLMVVFFCIDIARYFYVSIGLNYAAYRAVDQAAKELVEHNTDEASCTDASAPDNYERCERVKDIYLRAQALGLKYATMFARESSTDGSARLVRFRYFDVADFQASLVPWSDLVGIESDVAILRPGEAVRGLDKAGNTVNKYYHPIRPDYGTSITGARKTGWPDPSFGELWDNVLADAPMAAHLEVEYRPFTPFVAPLTGPIKISATQFAYRRAPNVGITSPGVADTYTPTPTPTPTDTPTETPTPSNTFTPSNTPTITNTRTITNTPTITATHSSSPTPSDTPTEEPTDTPWPTETDGGAGGPPGPTVTVTRTGTRTSTSTASVTVAAPGTATSAPTATVPPTATTIPTQTFTPTQTETPTITRTPTPTIDCVSFDPCAGPGNECACSNFLNGATMKGCSACRGQWSCQSSSYCSQVGGAG